MDVNYRLLLWILNYLRDRPQFVKMNGLCSDVQSISTGAPQGCCLSPILFCLYTNDCRSKHDVCSIIKYADDTVITGYLQNNNSSPYEDEVSDFVTWCNQNYLKLNVKKTKEMVFDFKKQPCDFAPIRVNDEVVELVGHYKYLGTIIDCKLTFKDQTDAMSSKANQRLYFLRKLKYFQVDNTILRLFYQSVIQSVLTFSIIGIYGLLSKESSRKLEKIVKAASRVIGHELCFKTVSELYSNMVQQKTAKILKDTTHPLFSNYVFLRSGNRLRMPSSKNNRFRFSFIPNSISLFNSKVAR